MTTHRKRRRVSTIIGGSTAVALAVIGIVLIAVACSAQQTPPHPSAAAQHPTPTAATNTPSRSAPKSSTSQSPEFAVPTGPSPRGPVLSRSTPTSIDIPAIGVHSMLMALGQNHDGSIQVPPLSKNSLAGWYDKSPTPGQLGPSIILGHIDSKAYGPAVFFKLGALKPGDTVAVDRADHTTATFRIDKVAEYSKTQFPTQAVYGNIDNAGLRLITCGGSFNPSAHSYDDNIVAYASLISHSSTT